MGFRTGTYHHKYALDLFAKSIGAFRKPVEWIVVSESSSSRCAPPSLLRLPARFSGAYPSRHYDEMIMMVGGHRSNFLRNHTFY